MNEITSSWALNDTQLNRNLTFPLDEDTYGFEIRFVRQIIGVQPITPLPDQPEYVKGVVNLRGQIIPIIDIRLRFGKVEKSYDERTCIIILDIMEMTVGVIVDSVSEVVTITDESITIAPEFKGVDSRFIRGIGRIDDNAYILINCAELVVPEN